MEIFEIKNLDCSKEEQRKKLLKETMRVIGYVEKPELEDLCKICKSLKKRYGIKLKTFNAEKIKTNKHMGVLEVKRGQFSTFDFDSKYECLCKYILLVKAWKEIKE